MRRIHPSRGGASAFAATGVPSSAPADLPYREVPFGRPPMSEAGVAAVAGAVLDGDLKAGGPATRRCEHLLREHLGAPAVFMLQSCTAALELSAALLQVDPGDEVIMPSFGFASAANAFVLRGATPVFVDVVPETLNIDPVRVRQALTDRTRAIVVVHYAGVAADMNALLEIASEAGIPLVEDAAQGLGATHHGRPLGSIGTLGAISFDATKNLSSGSGGALVINDPALAAEAEVLRDYGTDRARFTRGEIARYRWMDVGRNAAMNELGAAYLFPQLQELDAITARRRRVWQRYHAAFAGAEQDGLVRRPVVPAECRTNAHIYALMLPSAADREHMLRTLALDGVQASFHYVPLHSAPAGLRFGRTAGPLTRTTDLSSRLLRLPMGNDMPPADVDHVIASVLRRLAALPQGVPA